MTSVFSVRTLLVWVYAYAIWTLLTWTLTAEFLIVGAVLAVLVAVALTPVLADLPPVRIRPRRIATSAWPVLRLAARTIGMMVVANLSLARRIWSPSLPLHTGMVTVPTRTRTDDGVAAVGIVTSLIVDNQVVDIDRRNHLLLYHAIDVPDADRPEDAYDDVNGPIDRLVAAIEAAGRPDRPGDDTERTPA